MLTYDVLVGLLLGAVQGLAEFLPISSSAHLLVVPHLFAFEDPGLAFDTVLHLGTLSVVLFFYRNEWLQLFQIENFRRNLKIRSPEFNLLHIAVGCLPAGVIGLFTHDWIETNLRSPLLSAFTLALFGILLWLAERKHNQFMAAPKQESTPWTLGLALLIGCAQALALVPGVSRSGITITAALFLGRKRNEAARFSFMMSTPLIASAGLLKMTKVMQDINSASNNALLTQLISGFAASVIFGILALHALRWINQHNRLVWFTWYRLVLAAIIVAVLS